MKKPKKPWRRGGRLGPGLLDLRNGTLPRPRYAWHCCLCGADRSTTSVGVETLPGVSRTTNHAICASCLEERGPGQYCAGCDKSLVKYKRSTTISQEEKNTNWQADLQIGGKYEVHVCGERNEFSVTPKLQCKRKARRTLALCPGGCGGRGIEPGDLCKTCEGLIIETRRLVKTEADQKLHHTLARVPEELAELLANAVAGRGSKDPRVSTTRGGRAEIEVTVLPSQAEALKALVTAFDAFGERKRAEGFKEGNSFLTRLAKGSISMDELNKQST